MQIDRHREPKDLLPRIQRVFDVSAGRTAGDRGYVAARGRRAGLHRRRALPGARLDRVDAGVPVRLGAAAVRRHRRRRVPRARPRAHGRARWRRTSRTSACTTTASTTSAPTATCGGWRARDGIDATRLGGAVLRAGAQGQRRGAGAALDARCRTAASSTRSTARTRCSSTRSARCARWRSAHLLGQRLMEEQDASDQPARAARRSTRAPRRDYNVYYGARPRRLRRARPHGAREPVQRRQRHLPLPEHAAGLLAVQHVDARPGLGDARLRRGARVPRRCRRRARAVGGRDAVDAGCSKPRARPAISTSTTRPPPTACPTGTPARRASRALGDWRDRAADPFNDHEPVDSSAAAIAAQGLLRLGHCLATQRGETEADRYMQAGLRVVETLLDEART